MKSNRYLSFLAIGMIAIGSCKKIDTLESNKAVLPHALASDTDIYVAGYLFEYHDYNLPTGYGPHTPVYWKNGILNKLPAALGGYATDIKLQNGDVLIAGDELTDSTAETFQAVYWRNGIKTVLAPNATATRIFVDSTGTNFYIAGSIGKMACYWKNGIIHLLHCSGSAYDAEQANDIVVKGNDVYLAGMVQSVSSGKEYALYWKNDQLQTLPETNTNGDAYGITLNGNDVYIAGNNGSGASVWKNGAAANLPGGALAVGLAFVGSDLYATGADNVSGEGVYWKNNVLTSLSTSTYEAQATQCLAVLGTAVYIGGQVNPLGGAAVYIPAYWKNGVLNQLPYESNGAVLGITTALRH